jgi:uncharacterized membrane protein SpoIIM required for sporulation
MLDDLRPAWIITRREIGDQLRDWRIILPVFFLTLFFPALMNFTADQLVGFVERYGAPVIGERLIPFLLMIVGFFPISVSLVVALESFVGEKERHSIEPLLSSPLTDAQLYLGKLAAATFPPLLLAYLGITVYLIGVYLEVGWRPTPILLAQVILLTTVQAVVMVSGAVVVSSQTTSVRAANMLASFIIIPMALLIQGESVVMFWGSYSGLWWIIAGLAVIAGLLVRSGMAHFNREELLGREFDALNLRWSWRIFAQHFRGQARNPLAWYRQEVFPAVRRLGMPFAMMILGIVVGGVIGANLVTQFPPPPELIDLNSLDAGYLENAAALHFFSLQGIGMIWFHNLRAILIATLLGIFSFGVLSVLVLMLPFVLVGYLAAGAASAGYSAVLFILGYIVPHGLLEVPAAALAGAAILRLGATLATPADGMTIGEAWLRALADWAKIFIGLVLPLLLGAAAVEILVTPRIAYWLLGN